MVYLRRKVGAFLTQPLFGRAIRWLLGDKIPNKGLLFDTSGVDPTIVAQLFFSIYESAELRFIRRYLPTNLDVVELGSSLGVVSCNIRRRLNPECRLIAIEANPAMIPRAKQNLELNGLQVNVELLHGAIDYGQKANVFLSVADSTLSSRVAESSDGGTLLVPALTLADIVATRRISQFALVSDIEGAEAGLIYLDRETLSKCAVAIIELHNTTFGGHSVTTEEMIAEFQRGHSFHLLARRGRVCAFGRR